MPLDSASKLVRILGMVPNFGETSQKTYFSLAKLKKIGTELMHRHPKMQSVFIVLCANVFNNVVTFVVSIFLAKAIGPEHFGIFSLAVTVTMVVNIISDIGLNLTLVRFFNLYQRDEGRQILLLSSLFIFKIFVIVLLIVISIPFSSVFTQLLNLDLGYQPLFCLAIITGGIFTLWVYFQNYQQAHRNFVNLARYIFGYGMLRVICTGILLMLAIHTLKITFVFISLYAVPVVLITLTGTVPIVSRILSAASFKLPDVLNVLRDALKYSKWVALSSIFYSLILRVTQLILAFRASKYELGILSAGFIFTVAFSTLNMAVRTVFFPHVTSFEKVVDMKKYYLEIKGIAPYYVAIAAIMIIVLAFIQIAFLGKEYIDALPVFLITSIALSTTIFLGLWTMMVHTLMHPEIHAIVNILRLVTACIVVYFLSPVIGAIGGAIAYAVPLILGEVFMVVFVKREIDVLS